MAIFEGAGVALVTPMNENLEVNYDKLEELLEEQIAGGTDAIVICGTTGESATLTEEEHMRTIRFAIDKVNHRIPVVAGTGSNSTATATQMSKEAAEAGADGIMIHSKDKSGEDIKKFCYAFRQLNKSIPIVVVPTTYNHITETELASWGVNVIIYANHLLRSAYPAMLNTAKIILANERSFEANDLCMSVREILELIPGTK